MSGAAAHTGRPDQIHGKAIQNERGKLHIFKKGRLREFWESNNFTFFHKGTFQNKFTAC